MNGFDIKLYFKADGSFWGSVNGEEFQMHAWIGVQCEEWNKTPKQWGPIFGKKYVKNDLIQYLQTKNECKQW